ncbi:hypothetical protein [Amorphus sp. MBR-141]
MTMALDLPPPKTQTPVTAADGAARAGLPGKGRPPGREAVRETLRRPDPAETVALNFKVPAGFKRDFKQAALDYGVTQSALLQELLAEFRARRG